MRSLADSKSADIQKEIILVSFKSININHLNLIKMRKSFSIAHYCRASKASKKTGLAPIEMSVTVDGKRMYISLPRKEEPAKFAKAMVSKRSNDTKEFCTLWYSKINEIVLNLMRDDKDVTADNIKIYLNGGEKNITTCLTAWNEFMVHLRKRVDVDIHLSTYKKYELAKESFLKEIGNDTDIEKITPEQLENLYYTVRKSVSINVAAKYMQKFKAMLKYTGKADLFSNIKIMKEKKDIQTFNEEDYQKLKNTDFNFDSLNRMRDIAIFLCASGLSYSDVRELKPEDIKTDENGVVTIVKDRVKTGVTFYSVVLSEGVEILKKYNYQLPIISNQKGNLLLHSIENIINASAPITFHRCRHFYATRLIASGVPATAVMKALGHSSVQQSLHYTHLIEDNVKDNVTAHIK